jgi:hypothetical protein
LTIPRGRRSAATLIAVLFTAASCSSNDQDVRPSSTGTEPSDTGLVTDSAPATTSTPPSTTSTTATSTTATSTISTSPGTPSAPASTALRPDGPLADLSEEIVGAAAPFIGTSLDAGLDSAGYTESEHVAAGTATSYRAIGELTPDGRWTFEQDAAADYRTRILVRRPTNSTAFSGTVVVEWLNVSGGVDAAPDFTSLRADIVREGDIWVGVSAQLLGVEGGPVLVTVDGAESVAGKGLVAIDPERYGSLDHPGDGFSFDIFTQVARALRSGGAVLGGVTPTTVIAAGESQSAIALTTYLNGIHPLTQAFDGYFVHSRAAVPLPLVGPGEFADLAGGLGSASPTIVRTDTAVPVMIVQAEGDVTGVLNSAAARQPDSDTLRLWEVAGTAHADRFTLGAIADTLSCGAPINDGPMHVVTKAAYRALVTWAVDGTAPAEAPRLELTNDGGADGAGLRRDSDGIALGGIRTPPVDVPIDVLSGEPGSDPSLICLLLGTTQSLPANRIADLYASRADYEQRFASGADDAIEAGFVLAEDREALLAYAQPDRVN